MTKYNLNNQGGCYLIYIAIINPRSQNEISDHDNLENMDENNV